MSDRRLPSEKLKGAGEPNRIKRLLAAQLAREYGAAASFIMIHNKGLNSEQTLELRRGLREKGLRVRVVRNRVTIRVFEGMGLREVEKLFNGPTAVIASDDPVLAAKLAIEFTKKFDKALAIIGALVEGNALTAAEVEVLARSKGRKELQADIVAQVRSPGARLAGQMLGPGRALAGQIKALVEKLEKAEAAPAAAAPAEASAPKA